MKIIKLLVLLAAAALGTLYYQRFHAISNLARNQEAPAGGTSSYGQAPSRWDSNGGGIGKVGGLGQVGGVEQPQQNGAPRN